MKYHYTYLLTDLQPKSNQKYYIGVHSGVNDPENDGYMSSSQDINDLINNYGINRFEKTIITIWKSRKLAVQHEIKLHEEYNVKDNPLFYNKANQTSTGFDTSGKPMHPNTKKGLLKAITGRPCSEKVKKKNRQRNRLATNPWRKENRNGLLGNEFTSETARACALKRVKEGRHNFQNADEKHPMFKGYYHTPNGKYTSAPRAAYGGLNGYDIRYYCGNPYKVISKKRAKKSPVMTDKDVGKTFKELGFWFDPK